MVASDEVWRRSVHPWVTEGARGARFGIMLHPIADRDPLYRQARRVEELGYDGIWIYDHPLTIGAADCWTTLALLATLTERVRLGSAVSCVPFRQPALLARLAADVDQLSGGRLVLGVGAGDDEAEFAQMGIPYASLRERQEALEEAVSIVRGLWRGEPFTHAGRHFQVREARLQSLPVQRPWVPILIAGGGERVTLRQVADLGDMSNFGPHVWTGSAVSAEDVRRKFAALRAHCGTAGRPYDAVCRSYFAGIVLAGTDREAEARRAAAGMADAGLEMPALGPAAAIAHYQELVDAGVQYFIVWVLPDDDETLTRLAREVAPALRSAVSI